MTNLYVRVRGSDFALFHERLRICALQGYFPVVVLQLTARAPSSRQHPVAMAEGLISVAFRLFGILGTQLSSCSANAFLFVYTCVKGLGTRAIDQV